jgi:hypothetical protein
MTNIELARECQLLDGLAVVPSQVDRYTALIEARLMAKLVKIVEEAVSECDAIKFSEHAEGYADGARACLIAIENWGTK